MSKKTTRDDLRIFDWVPVFEDIDLGLNATNATVTTKLFDYITRVIITLRFADAATEYTEFLAGSALTNGIFVTVDGKAITPVIKTKGQLMEIGIASTMILDDNDNVRVYQVILDFSAWCGGLGLQIQKVDGNRSLIFDINDDLSSITGLFVANVQGWKAT